MGEGVASTRRLFKLGPPKAAFSLGATLGSSPEEARENARILLDGFAEEHPDSQTVPAFVLAFVPN
jgi:hypothetical protein